MFKPWIIASGTVMMLVAAQTQAAGQLECRSSGYRYQYCSADTENNVELVQQISSSACKFGRSWGYDARGIWVDNGCAASFRYGRSHGGGGSHGDKVAAELAGALIVAAIVGSQSRHHGDDDGAEHVDASVPPWAVGRFAGQDFESGVGIELAIDRKGRIDGYQGGREFYGQVRGNEAWIGNREYGLMQTRDGIRLVGEGRSGFDLTRN
ncbi:MAG TPA: DUF3011 domain-containing protein [Rubrivivax sp.]|nr:DUF3011 domain-containing protein [Burkholderiales bacterium]HNT37958.1 DUF3011 domain-containing protein [Rubrivivax sp.]